MFTDLFLSQICLCCSFHFLLLILHPLSILHACMTFASTNSPAMPSSPPLIHLYMLLLAYLPPHLPLVTTPAYLPASLSTHPPLISTCLSIISFSSHISLPLYHLTHLSYLPACCLSSHPSSSHISLPVHHLILLSYLSASLQVKCNEYWPKQGAIQYGQMVVTVEREKVFPEFIMRTFIIAHEQQKKEVPEMSGDDGCSYC